MSRKKVIDLFSGIGGLSYAFHKNNNFEIIAANEIDSEIAESYKKNYKDTYMINSDIKEFIINYKKNFKSTEIDIILGGPPCQGFSLAGKRNRSNGKDFINDERNFLFREYIKIVKQFSPKIFIIENVPGIISINKGKILEEIINSFSKAKNFKNGVFYNIYYDLFNFSDYGVPQERKRFILIAVRNDLNIYHSEIAENLKSTKDMLFKNSILYDVNIYDAISDLPMINSGEGRNKMNYLDKSKTLFQKELRINSNYIYNHKATNHNELALKRIKLSTSTKTAKEIDQNIRSIHSGSYKRMNWNDKAKTIITRFDTPSSGQYIHPVLNRTISPREAARLQSFPDEVIFYGSKSSVCKQIGNAVPPKFSRFLLEFCCKILEISKEK